MGAMFEARATNLAVFGGPGRYVQGRDATAQLGEQLKESGVKPGPVIIVASSVRRAQGAPEGGERCCKCLLPPRAPGDLSLHREIVGNAHTPASRPKGAARPQPAGAAALPSPPAACSRHSACCRPPGRHPWVQLASPTRWSSLGASAGGCRGCTRARAGCLQRLRRAGWPPNCPARLLFAPSQPG